jgi:hypothetical protein
VRSDLQKLPGITDITTDIEKTQATFKIGMEHEALKAKLEEYGKTNEHMKGWSFMEPEKKSS